MTRELRGSKGLLWQGSFDVDRLTPPVRRETDLQSETGKLWEEISQLRRLLAKAHKFGIADRQQPKSLETAHALAELLALSDSNEAEQLMVLLKDGSRNIDSIIQALGTDRAIWLSNMLGRAKVAVADTGKLVATDLGRALFASLEDLASPR